VADTTERTRALDISDPIGTPPVYAVAIPTMLILLFPEAFFTHVVTVGPIAAAIVTTKAFQHFGQRPILLSQGTARKIRVFPVGTPVGCDYAIRFARRRRRET
jgi:hypothetical protein